MFDIRKHCKKKIGIFDVQLFGGSARDLAVRLFPRPKMLRSVPPLGELREFLNNESITAGVLCRRTGDDLQHWLRVGEELARLRDERRMTLVVDVYAQHQVEEQLERLRRSVGGASASSPHLRRPPPDTECYSVAEVMLQLAEGNRN